MSKAALDSDLYGDIYGDDEDALLASKAETSGADDEFQFQDPEGLEEKPVSEASSSPTTAKSTLNDDEKTTQVMSSNGSPGASSQSSTPAAGKVEEEGAGNEGSGKQKQNGNGLSYSAQIAQQFSVYQQTPSQERQQRNAFGSGSTNRAAHTNGTAPIATLESSGGTAFGMKPSEMHDHGKLFIGGLSWDTTDGTLSSPKSIRYLPLINSFPYSSFIRAEGLAKYFSQFGKVDAVTIMRDPSGTSRGFAFLTFEDGSVVNNVITSEHFLDGKTIDPKRAIPREEHLRNTRYFVGGLAPNTTSESMKEFFGTYGKVVDATVMVDRDTGRSKGFGFVTFEDATNTDQLVGKALTLDEKQIEVKAAQPRSQRDQARVMTGNVGTGSPVGGVNRGETFENRLQATNVPFIQQQQNPMASMLMQGQRPNMRGMIGGGGGQAGGMNQMGMNMNQMAMMGMMNGMGGMGGVGGMNGMNGMNMMGGMNGMGGMGMMNGMNMMGGMGNMGGMGGNMGGGMGGGNMGQMNAMGNMGQMGNMGNMGGMNNMGNMAGGMRLGMGPMGAQMGGGMVGMGMRSGMNPMAGMNRMQANAGVGPLRMSSRGDDRVVSLYFILCVAVE
uniref:RRM domain-containing protein n=1 Tax=Moniliophthora roreri TaxID=221103 RepID=A0A0W0G355_MONRR